MEGCTALSLTPLLCFTPVLLSSLLWLTFTDLPFLPSNTGESALVLSTCLVTGITEETLEVRGFSGVPRMNPLNLGSVAIEDCPPPASAGPDDVL